MTLAMTTPSASSKTSWRRLRKHQASPVLQHVVTSGTAVLIHDITSRNPNQMYYWTPEWQSDEDAARADILAGRITTLDSPEEMEKHFNELTEQARRRRRGTA